MSQNRRDIDTLILILTAKASCHKLKSLTGGLISIDGVLPFQAKSSLSRELVRPSGSRFVVTS